MMPKIAALFVHTNGPYFNNELFDPWDIKRDARLYNGPLPVIAHPPCERWGRYWSGGPSAKKRRTLGDDNGCFDSALSSVRRFGGIIEHPEASHAFKAFSLPRPSWHGGWSKPDRYGGRSCCIAQGNYGHLARKMTWLYSVNINFDYSIIWGASKGGVRLDQVFHSKEERARAIKTGVCQRLSKRQRLITPQAFQDLLVNLILTK